MVKGVALILALAVALPASASADYDKRKFAELAKRREHRRAVEAFYEACLRARAGECLEKARKYSEKRLAGLSSPR